MRNGKERRRSISDSEDGALSDSGSIPPLPLPRNKNKRKSESLGRHRLIKSFGVGSWRISLDKLEKPESGSSSTRRRKSLDGPKREGSHREDPRRPEGNLEESPRRRRRDSSSACRQSDGIYTQGNNPPLPTTPRENCQEDNNHQGEAYEAQDRRVHRDEGQRRRPVVQPIPDCPALGRQEITGQPVQARDHQGMPRQVAPYQGTARHDNAQVQAIKVVQPSPKNQARNTQGQRAKAPRKSDMKSILKKEREGIRQRAQDRARLEKLTAEAIERDKKAEQARQAKEAQKREAKKTREVQVRIIRENQEKQARTDREAGRLQQDEQQRQDTEVARKLEKEERGRLAEEQQQTEQRRLEREQEKRVCEEELREKERKAAAHLAQERARLQKEQTAARQRTVAIPQRKAIPPALNATNLQQHQQKFVDPGAVSTVMPFADTQRTFVEGRVPLEVWKRRQEEQRRREQEQRQNAEEERQLRVASMMPFEDTQRTLVEGMVPRHVWERRQEEERQRWARQR